MCLVEALLIGFKMADRTKHERKNGKLHAGTGPEEE
jgi:hypothetical protein